MLECLEHCNVNAISHITGGGFIENIPRALNDFQGVTIREAALPKNPIFPLMERLGEIDHSEMYNIFNMGIGMVLILPEEESVKAIEILSKHNYNPRIIGVVTNTPGVEII